MWSCSILYLSFRNGDVLLTGPQPLNSLRAVAIQEITYYFVQRFRFSQCKITKIIQEGIILSDTKSNHSQLFDIQLCFRILNLDSSWTAIYCIVPGSPGPWRRVHASCTTAAGVVAAIDPPAPPSPVRYCQFYCSVDNP